MQCGRFSSVAIGSSRIRVSMQLAQPRMLRAAAATLGAVTAGSACYMVCRRRSCNMKSTSSRQRFKIPPAAVEALAGAVGELVQVVALYPLDTVKVRCQSMDLSTKEVMQQLLKASSNPVQLIQHLYAGVLGAALCSVVIGAVHYASYESSKRFLVQRQQPRTSQQCLHRHAVPPGTEGRSSMPDHNQHHSHECPDSSGSSSSTAKLSANVLAAVFASLVTALVESPVELFRHNQQAGNMKGSFVREMIRVVRARGPMGLYWGFLPHCLEAWPHDGSELLVYGAMKDLKRARRASASHHHQWHPHGPHDRRPQHQHQQQNQNQSQLQQQCNQHHQQLSHQHQHQQGASHGHPHFAQQQQPQQVQLVARGSCSPLQSHEIECATSVEERHHPSHAHSANAGPAHRGSWVDSLPEQVWDLTTGAASGAAAVLVSMPFDCIKTRLQTSVGHAAGKGLVSSARLYLSTGQKMVAQRGIGALYYGVTPRLLQQVPSAMLCWWAVHAVERMLLPYTAA